MIATSGFSVKGLGHAWYKLLDPVSDPAAYSALSTPNTVQASGQGIWWFEMADSRRAVLSEPEPDAARQALDAAEKETCEERAAGLPPEKAAVVANEIAADVEEMGAPTLRDPVPQH